MFVNFFLPLLSLLFFSAIGNFAHGQDASAFKESLSPSNSINKLINRNTMADGISGLMVNNMITPIGHQFFQLFCNNWQENPESNNYSLYFVETTSRLRGSQVFIYSGTKLMFVSGLPFKSSQLMPVIDQAVDAINTNIISMAMNSGSSDIDLAEEEL